MILDVRTITIMASVISIVLFACLALIFFTRKTYPGFKAWTTAMLLASLCYPLLGLRGYIPDFLSIVIANGIAAFAVSLIGYGLEVFSYKKPNMLLYSLSIIASLFFLSFYTYYLPDVNTRVVIISLILSILYFKSAYISYVFVPKVSKKRNYFLPLIYLFLASLFAFRTFATAFSSLRIEDFMQASIFHGFIIILHCTGHILSTIGLIALNYQRIENALLESKEELKVLRGIIPICYSCKKIRDDSGYWNQLETFIKLNSEAEFSHGICPDCVSEFYPEFRNLEKKNESQSM